MKKRDLTGQQFGRLTVLEDSGKRQGGRVVWNCLCECGTRHSVSAGSLINGVTRSCGCLGRGPAAAKRLADKKFVRPNRVTTNEKLGPRRVSAKSLKPSYEPEDLLFQVITQACRDIVFYTHPEDQGGEEAFLHAYEWIMDDIPQDTVVDIDDDGEFIWGEITFREALEGIGVDPRNVDHIRHTIARGPGLLHKERKRLARECYAKLEGEEYEPGPWWRCVENLILNKEPAY